MTVAAAGVLAYALVVLLHEGAGHGVACVLTGGRALAMSSTELRCEGVDGLGAIVVASAGSLVNLIVGIGILALGLLRPPRSGLAMLTAWLAGSWNGFHAGSYLVVGALVGFGDWGRVAAAVGGPAGAVIVGGAGLAVLWLVHRLSADSAWQPLVGVAETERSARWGRLTWPALGAGLVVSLLAGVLTPLVWEIALVSAAAGPATLLWLARHPHRPDADRPEPARTIARSPAIIGLALVVAVGFVALLGPGIGSFAGYAIAR